MKAKFTLLIAAGLLVSVATMAQDRGYDNDHRDNSFRSDNRYERHDNFDYRTKMFNLQQQLNHEMDELDRARECGDWDKARHEKREIAETRFEIKKLQRHKYFDNDYHERL